jgi:hypothetical protein
VSKHHILITQALTLLCTSKLLKKLNPAAAKSKAIAALSGNPVHPTDPNNAILATLAKLKKKLIK